MDPKPLVLDRPAMLSVADLERIEDAAGRILREVGMEVRGRDVADRLAARGFRATDGRVRIEPALFRAFLREERERHGRAFSTRAEPPRPETSAITVGISNYALHVHDLATDRIVPFSTERLVEATKLADVLSERGVRATAPGTPTDVPGPLQPVVQLWVSATHSRHGRHPIDIKSAASLPHVVAMTEVLGQPLEFIAVYVFTPLALCGESLACALGLGKRLKRVGVAAMPALGSTASIRAGDAFALAAAEVVGGAILVRELLGIQPQWFVGLFPADMRSLMQVFGSPENFLLQLMSSEVNAFLHGQAWRPGAANVHVMAKMPGPQACAERAALLAAGALLGERYFANVGTLSLDEVFSAEQLLWDLEIKDGAERLVRGMDGACDPARCLGDLAEALASGSFAALEATRDACRQVYWQPRFFERRSLAGWQAAGEPDVRLAVHDEVRRCVARHDYALPPDEQRAIDAILARARADLA